MKLLIAGSRTIGKSQDGSYDYDTLVSLISHTIAKYNLEPDLILSGGANGPDKAGEEWAKINNVRIMIFKPDWSIGRGAGIINNKRLVDNADALLVMYDGQSKGTLDTIKRFKKQGKPIYYAED